MNYHMHAEEILAEGFEQGKEADAIRKLAYDIKKEESSIYDISDRSWNNQCRIKSLERQNTLLFMFCMILFVVVTAVIIICLRR